jgi:hypothetical protein
MRCKSRDLQERTLTSFEKTKHVTSHSLGLRGAMTLSGAALAADLPSRAPPPVFLPPPAFTWSGIYMGLTAGFDQATHNIDDLDFSSMASRLSSEAEHF